MSCKQTKSFSSICIEVNCLNCGNVIFLVMRDGIYLDLLKCLLYFLCVLVKNKDAILLDLKIPSDNFSHPLLHLKDQPCRYNSSGMAAQCKGYKEVPKGNERALAVALFKVGPVSVGIDATQPTFQFYQRGQ